jgi:hypothetical protein
MSIQLLGDRVPTAVRSYILTFLKIGDHAHIRVTNCDLRRISRFATSAPYTVTIAVPHNSESSERLINMLATTKTSRLRLVDSPSETARGDIDINDCYGFFTGHMRPLSFGLTPRHWRRVCAMTWLTELNVSVVHASGECLTPLVGLHKLANLALDLDAPDTTLDLAPLNTLTTLEQLTLRFDHEPPNKRWDVGCAVRALTALRSLTVHNAQAGADRPTHAFDLATDAIGLPRSLTHLDVYVPGRDRNLDQNTHTYAAWLRLLQLPLVHLSIGIIMYPPYALHQTLDACPTLRHLACISATILMRPQGSAPLSRVGDILRSPWGLTELVLSFGDSIYTILSALPTLQRVECRLSSTVGFDSLAGVVAPSLTTMHVHCDMESRDVPIRFSALCALVAPKLETLAIRVIESPRDYDGRCNTLAEEFGALKMFSNLTSLTVSGLRAPQPTHTLTNRSPPEPPLTLGLPTLERLRTLNITVDSRIRSWIPDPTALFAHYPMLTKLELHGHHDNGNVRHISARRDITSMDTSPSLSSTHIFYYQ